MISKMKTIDNKQFMKILHDCCQGGQLDDEKLNSVLKTLFPYVLTFGKGCETDESS